MSFNNDVRSDFEPRTDSTVVTTNSIVVTQSVATVTREVTARAPDVNSAVNLPLFCTTLENAGTKKDLKPGAMKIATARVVNAAIGGGAISRTEESPFVASLGIEVDLQVRWCRAFTKF